MTRRGGWGPSGEGQGAPGAGARRGEAEGAGARRGARSRGERPGQGTYSFGRGQECRRGSRREGPAGARAAGAAGRRQRGAAAPGPRRLSLGLGAGGGGAGDEAANAASLAPARASGLPGYGKVKSARSGRLPPRRAGCVRGERAPEGAPQGPGRGRGRGLRAGVSLSACVRAWGRGSRCWEPGGDERRWPRPCAPPSAPTPSGVSIPGLGERCVNRGASV